MPAKNRILVVDDEDALRTVLSSELEGEGYIVQMAGDGDDQHSRKEQFRPDPPRHQNAYR
jgi:CheY-like chemotaxis protein